MIFVDNKELDSSFGDLTGIDSIFVDDKEVWTNNKVVDLGDGQYFDVKSIIEEQGLNIDYTQLTVDNFYFSNAGASASVSIGLGHDYWAPTGYWGRRVTLEKSYNQSTGILTFRIRLDADDRTMGNSNSVYVGLRAYLITKPEKLISLGTNTSFNYPNYALNNFLVKDFAELYRTGGYNAGASITTSYTFVKTYTNGILKCYVTNSGAYMPVSVYFYKKGVQ